MNTSAAGYRSGIDDSTILRELEPLAASLLERHISSAKEWFPHEHIPYERGRAHRPDRDWTEADTDLAGASIPDAVRSALVVNLLTEDNLPYYFRTIARMFGTDSAWGEWARRWTAEEGRHSMVIYGYLMVTRAVDPVALERARMHQVSGGNVPEPPTAGHGFFYVALQELATRIAHRNTGTMLGDPAGYDVMMRVATDENRHHLFYRDMCTALFELAPNIAMQALHDEVINFEMPGTGIIDFSRHAAAIAKAGIYDLSIHHDQILQPMVMRQWAVEQVKGLDADGERARDRLIAHLEKSGRVAKRLAERRAAVGAGV